MFEWRQARVCVVELYNCICGHNMLTPPHVCNTQPLSMHVWAGGLRSLNEKTMLTTATTGSWNVHTPISRQCSSRRMRKANRMRKLRCAPGFYDAHYIPSIWNNCARVAQCKVGIKSAAQHHSIKIYNIPAIRVQPHTQTPLLMQPKSCLAATFFPRQVL